MKFDDVKAAVVGSLEGTTIGCLAVYVDGEGTRFIRDEPNTELAFVPGRRLDHEGITYETVRVTDVTHQCILDGAKVVSYLGVRVVVKRHEGA